MDSGGEPSYRRRVSRARADAWRELPPFDRLHEAIDARSTPDLDPIPCPDDVPVHVKVEGTWVTVRVTAPGEPTMHVQFRWRESHQEWQLHACQGSRWIGDGPPRASVGRLLENLMIGALLANASMRRVGGSVR